MNKNSLQATKPNTKSSGQELFSFRGVSSETPLMKVSNMSQHGWLSKKHQMWAEKNIPADNAVT